MVWMLPKNASRTAFLVAGYRARASARPSPICHDPWAAALAGDEGLMLADRFGSGGWQYGELWIALRTVFIDRELAGALDSGFGQVVILGAGLDARAARMGREGVRYFEVDQPNSQAEKLARIAQAQGYPGSAATFVTCDFEHDDFLDQLSARGFDALAPAVFVWEGVTLYLVEAAVRSTLRRIASGCHPQSRVVFDHVGSKLAAGRTNRPDDVQVLASLDGVGEPIRFGIDDILPLLFDEGFRYVRTTSFDELALAQTGTYVRERAFRFQHVTVASRTAP